jgi:large repetitive protein
VSVTDDDGGSGSASTSVTVRNVAPVVNAGPDAAIAAGASFTSSGSFTDPGSDSWSATVDYGDGSNVQTLALSANKGFSLSHSYAAPGAYLATVRVQDSGGAVGSDSAVVTVSTASCLTTLSAKAKSRAVQLNWSASEHTPTTRYDVYRSTQGANAGFTKIRSGYTNLYPVFADSGLTNGVTYYYRIEKSLAPAGSGYCSSRVVSAKPAALF